MSSSEDDKNLYNYDPNDILPLVAAAIFAATLGLHLWQAFRSKSYNYMWAFILGIVLETGGYLCRRLSTQKQDSLMLFVIQQLLVVVAPALLAASLYQSYGRLTLFVQESYSPMRPRLVTKIFVTFDVISFFVQGAGGGLYAGDNITAARANLAKAVILVGFVIQLVAFSGFLVISFIFYRRARRGSPNSHAIKLVPVLWITSVAILVRTIFRFAEFASSQDGGKGYLLDHEIFLYVLETIPIVVAVVYFGIFHPSRYIPNSKLLRESELEQAFPMHRPMDKLP